jgi:hypothetical protein
VAIGPVCNWVSQVMCHKTAGIFGGVLLPKTMGPDRTQIPLGSVGTFWLAGRAQ